MTATTEMIDLLNTNPNITHVLMTSIVGAESGDGVNSGSTTVIYNRGQAFQLMVNQLPVSIAWNSHGKRSTRFFTCYSIYSDAVTLMHGRRVAAYASQQIGKAVHATVLRRLEIDAVISGQITESTLLPLQPQVVEEQRVATPTTPLETDTEG